MKNITIKTIYKQIAFGVIFLCLAVVGCQDKLEELHVDPSVFSPDENVLIPGMFSGMMQQGKTFKMDYAEYWNHGNFSGVLTYLQYQMRAYRTAYGYLKSESDVLANAVTDSNSSYYNSAQSFKELPTMEVILGKLEGEARIDAEVYIPLARIAYIYRFHRAVDLFDDVPYTETLKALEGNFYPKIESGLDVYRAMIADLKEYAETIPSLYSAMTDDGKSTFATQDIVFQGNIDKWVELATSLRLRFAVRIQAADETLSKSTIAEVLSSGNLPNEDLMIPAQPWVSNDRGHWKLGYSERDYAGFVTPFMWMQLDRDGNHKYDAGIDDPRLGVYMMPNRDGLYMTPSMNCDIGQKIFDKINGENGGAPAGGAYVAYNYFNGNLDDYLYYNSYSLWNPATLVRVIDDFPAFTYAEVKFLLAEAYLNGLASGDAAAEVEAGVLSSINYWYKINEGCTWSELDNFDAKNATKTAMLQPVRNDGDISAYAAKIAGEYASASDKMEVIHTQKWMNFLYHNPYEAWTEVRRTRYPKLATGYFGSTSMEPHLERYPYPGSLSSSNPDAYSEVVGKDNFTTPIFWVADTDKSKKYRGEYDQTVYTKYPGIPETYKGGVDDPDYQEALPSPLPD
ncbi:SusD/RagB family nutrient-binding outer membrane lipoprotein [Reichenbachiella sp. MALMAid0571]|uniref:SusD/RagB family nutrient-binding outer membrane lipoprotein n=1 Tax=Reichenbachiella sp. MALMAid0571 TaxID=3143939 RepID=UPI0032DFD514